MGDLLNDIDLTDIIPSFAPARSSSPTPDSDPRQSSSTLPTNSQTPPPPQPPTSGASSNADSPADGGPTQSSPSRSPGGSTSTSPPTTNPDSGTPNGSSTDTTQSSSPVNGHRNGRNGTLSVQPKPAALVGTTGSTNNAPKASNTNNSGTGVDGAAAASAAASGGMPIGAILGSVLAGVIMITLAVTLLVAMRRKSRIRRQARIEPIARNRSHQGRAGLMELGAKEEDDAWNVKEAPQLPPLQLTHDVSPTLDMTFTAPTQPSPVHEMLPPAHGLLTSASQQRPDSVGSIQDAPMNYFVTLEERVPRAGLRVMNRASSASVADE